MNGAPRKTVVVTGAGSGLGRELAMCWARRGWRIGVSDVNPEGAKRTLELVEAAGGSGEVFLCDVRDPESVRSMADHFFSSRGRVDVLVNNAGVIDAGSICEVRIEDWQRVMDTCFWGSVHGCQSFIPGMRAQGGGHIVNTASIAGIISMPEAGPYNACKAAVVSLSETMRSELAPDGIGVTVACPSVFETNLLDGMTVSDDWERSFISSAFDNSRMGASEVARRIVAAVDSNRLYAFPQTPAKLARALTRLSPRALYTVLAVVYRSKHRRPIFTWMARNGLT